MARAADQVKRVTLELGGKSANIVFADADLEKAAATAPYGVFDNAGSGLLRAQPDPRAAQRLRPVPRAARAGRRRASRSGARARRRRDGAADQRRRSATASRRTWTTSVDVAFRGSAPDGPGYWYPPTVVLPARRRATAVWREEVFGPVVVVLPFDDEADAIRDGQRHGVRPVRARSGPATSAARCGSPAAIETGNLSVNSHSSVRYSTPFGGFKQSGLGRELGPDALDSFTDVKNVFISTED